MKRDLSQDLVRWKKSSRRKPLLLRGARQTGKTYLLKNFGQNQYRRCHYFNFEEKPELDGFFQANLDPLTILSDLSIYQKEKIEPKNDLIIFDEIQSSNRALTSLKYFQEKINHYHIAAAGSLLGIKLSKPGSFPVGKVNFLDLYPLSFLEFLDAVGDSHYREYLENLEKLEPIASAFHDHLIFRLRQYYFVGGMPEAVAHFVQSEEISEVRKIQKEIIDAYVLDFAKHAPATDTPKLSLIWNSIPKHLAKENKKFIFSILKKGGRARDFENALQWLKDTGLIHKVFAVESNQFPLQSQADTNCYKVYCLDVGILGALAKVPSISLVQGEELFTSYFGSLVENYVAEQLIDKEKKDLVYWRNPRGKAEVDFLFEKESKVYPLEVKAGINPKSKSLRAYEIKYNPKIILRSNLLNLKKNGKIVNIPLYAIGLISKFINLA